MYLQADVLQLADIFGFADMAFLPNIVLKIKKYISLPSYSYDSMLKMSGVTIELITDVSAYLIMNQQYEVEYQRFPIVFQGQKTNGS